jgi:hypothetical protein
MCGVYFEQPKFPNKLTLVLHELMEIVCDLNYLLRCCLHRKLHKHVLKIVNKTCLSYKKSRNLMY